MTADGGQVRFHVKAPRRQAEALYAALDAAFEEDGLPLAIVEFDEAAGIHEVSLYAFDDLDAIERQARQDRRRRSAPTWSSSGKRCPTSTGWRVRWRG